MGVPIAIAVLTLVYWLGGVVNTIGGLEPAAIRDAQDTAVAAVERAQGDAIKAVEAAAAAFDGARADAVKAVGEARSAAVDQLERTRADAVAEVHKERHEAADDIKGSVEAIAEGVQRKLTRKWCQYGTDQRRLGQLYENGTGAPLELAVHTSAAAPNDGSCGLSVHVNRKRVVYQQDLSSERTASVCSATVTIPIGATYTVDSQSTAEAAMASLGWLELRPRC